MKTSTQLLDDLLALHRDSEQALKDFRDQHRETMHPWALPSLANAIGAAQAFQSHLRAAKEHMEMPEIATAEGAST